MLSPGCAYVIRSVAIIGRESIEDRRIQVQDLANQLNISRSFLAKLLQQLAKANLITSVKGPYGGFHFTKKQLNGRLLRIIEEIDGKNVINRCVLGFPECSDTNPCAIHELYAPSSLMFRGKIRDMTIREFARSTALNKT